MNNPARFCEHCGATLPLDARFCKNCGQPVAIPFYPPPVPPQSYPPQPTPVSPLQPPPYSPPPAAFRPPVRPSRTWLWVLLGGLALLGACLVCVLLTGVGAFLFPVLQRQPTRVVFTKQTAIKQTEPLPTSMEDLLPTETVFSPTDTEISPTGTATPSAPDNPLPAATKGPHGTYQDDFSKMNSGWSDTSNDNYIVGYFQQLNYAIGIFQPHYTAWVLPPHNLPGPFQEAIVQVSAKPGGYGGTYGILCGYQDDKNYYQISFADDTYSIGKVVQDKYYPLTDPEWMKADDIKNVDTLGYIHLIVNCMQGSIGIQINDFGQKMVTDPDNSFPYGNVALFASAGSTKRDSFYNQTLFDDFKLEVNP